MAEKLYLYSLMYHDKEILNVVEKNDKDGVWKVLNQMVIYGKDKGSSSGYIIHRRPFQYGKERKMVDRVFHFIQISSIPRQYEYYHVNINPKKVGQKHTIWV